MPLRLDPPCINLEERFGHIYRIFWDQAYDPNFKHVSRDRRDPWYMELRGGRRGPGRCGGPGFTIYPYGHDTLALECDYAYCTAKKVAAIPGVRLWQDGDREKTFLFDVALFDQVVAIVKPRRRRHLSEERKVKMSAIGQEALSRYRQANSHSNAAGSVSGEEATIGEKATLPVPTG